MTSLQGSRTHIFVTQLGGESRQTVIEHPDAPVVSLSHQKESTGIT
jgi:hypothetical protein